MLKGCFDPSCIGDHTIVFDKLWHFCYLKTISLLWIRSLVIDTYCLDISLDKSLLHKSLLGQIFFHIIQIICQFCPNFDKNLSIYKKFCWTQFRSPRQIFDNFFCPNFVWYSRSSRMGVWIRAHLMTPPLYFVNTVNSRWVNVIESH